MSERAGGGPIELQLFSGALRAGCEEMLTALLGEDSEVAPLNPVGQRGPSVSRQPLPISHKHQS